MMDIDEVLISRTDPAHAAVVEALDAAGWSRDIYEGKGLLRTMSRVAGHVAVAPLDADEAEPDLRALDELCKLYLSLRSEQVDAAAKSLGLT